MKINLKNNKKSGKNTLNQYLNSKKLLESIINLLSNNKHNINTTIDIVNITADYIQYNNEYSNVEEVDQLADYIVYIIEEFNNREIKLSEVDVIIRKLENYLLNIKSKVINNREVDIYFLGRDKYNIVQNCFSKNINIINLNNVTNKNIFSLLNNENINVLILSEETVYDIEEFYIYFDEVIKYDQTMNEMFIISEKIYYSNYDYNYLIKSLEKCKSKDIETIIVGNSYPLTGIEVDLLNSKCISLALSSQDLYYSYKLAKFAIKNNKKITRCIIGAGYYLVNHDLSKSLSDDAISRVKNVYYPILKDKHNSKEVDEIKILNLQNTIDNEIIQYIFDLEFLNNHFKDLIYRNNNGYFNCTFTRENNNMLRGYKLSSISEEEKIKLGEFRANQHNKLFKYTDTTKEYNIIFNQFIDMLIQSNVEPIIVVFPNTIYYSRFLDKNYKIEFYKILNKIKEKSNVKIIDFSNEDIFTFDDFIDFDHMSELGAIKITKELNRRLKL